MIFVDQAPLQNSTLDGWDSRFCNRSMNNPIALAALQTTLELDPARAYKGTIEACLAYRSHPQLTDNVGMSKIQLLRRKKLDDEFFLRIAIEGKGPWYGKLMADHTALDWRSSITATFGPRSGSKTKVLVIASERSGCFPAAGPMAVVDLVNGDGLDPNGTGEIMARGEIINWGGHWCYWEQPKKFNDLVIAFLED